MFIWVLFAVLFTPLNCWRFFHNGRSIGGNLGEPDSKHSDNYIGKLYGGDFERWFTQNLDHFNPVDVRQWQQRYFINEDFFQRSEQPVVFLQIGGEGEASDKWMTQGAWIEYAKEFKALCFQLEHRYYGKSRPTSDLSTKNLRYLTSQQALADLAFFIQSMNEKHNLVNAKWIAFGGSYPGSLAAWLRLKYPNLVHGSMSASGPLLAKLDFDEYFQVVDQDLKLYGQECLDAVQTGTKQVETLLLHMVGQRNLDQMFKLCDPVENHIQNAKDISNLFESLSGNFAGIAQYNKDNRIGANAMSNITLDDLCGIMTNQSIGAQVRRLAAVNDLILQATNQTCLDYSYTNMTNQLRQTSWESSQAEGGRQWTYQTCTEFGFFQTSSYKPQVYSNRFPVEFFIDQCTDVFGPNFNKTFLDNAIKRTNNFYGALNIQVSNVVFVHGSIDPWHALGITSTKQLEAPAIYINGTAHCANMYPSADSDLPQLKAAREKIKALIGAWLD